MHRAALGGWWGDGNRAMRRGGLVLLFDAEPELQYNAAGEPVGIDAWVRAFRGGNEIKIDPHRRFFNPPVGRNPLVEYEQMLFDQIAEEPNARGWRTRGTVSTFFSSTADGRIVSSGANYNSARAGGSLTANDSNTADRVGQYGFFSTWECYESFLSFDTSSLPDTDTIDSAVLAVYGSTDSTGTSDFTIRARIHDWGGSLTTTDWVAGANLSGKTLVASFDTSGFSTSGYNSFTSESAFTSNVNKTGTTYLIISSSRHEAGTTAGQQEQVQFYMANESGTSKDPKLTVTHTASSASATITGTVAAMTMAAVAGTVVTQVSASVTGGVATMTAAAHEGVVPRSTAVTGTVATLTATALAGVVAAKRALNRAVGAIGSARGGRPGGSITAKRK